MNTIIPSEYRKGGLLCLVLLHLLGYFYLMFMGCRMAGEATSKTLYTVWEVMKGVLWKLKNTCESLYDFLSFPVVHESNVGFYDTGQEMRNTFLFICFNPSDHH